MNYWNIILWDGEEIQVRPDSVELIKQKIAKEQGQIVTQNRTINVKDIRAFLESDKPYKDPNQKLISTDEQLAEDVSRVFNEPMENSDGTIISKPVKKKVTNRMYQSYYAPHGTYVQLDRDEMYTTIGWLMPVHLIDYDKVQDCTEVESRQVLTNIGKL